MTRYSLVIVFGILVFLTACSEQDQMRSVATGAITINQPDTQSGTSSTQSDNSGSGSGGSSMESTEGEQEGSEPSPSPSPSQSPSPSPSAMPQQPEKPQNNGDQDSDSDAQDDDSSSEGPKKPRVSREEKAEARAACKALKKSGVADVVRITGSEKAETFVAKKPVIVRITGNQNKLDLTISGTEAIEGICLFVAGNQGSLKVTVNSEIKNLVTVQRGNESSITIQGSQSGKVSGSFIAEQKGNGSKLQVSGVGKCPSVGSCTP